MARCTIERLTREIGIASAVRGKKVITTIADPGAERAPDLADREFVATASNRCWVADLTHIATWAGVVYVAFVVDTFSRRILGWSATTSKEAQLVLNALDMGLWQHDHEGRPPTRAEGTGAPPGRGFARRIQPVVATPSCWIDSRWSLRASAGVFQSRLLRGRL
ncbi:transposase InsO family protein [Kitasatospora sp. GAS204A]|nr:transposase InsO family protein [Kitasatospora sp. GAS204B]